VKPYYSDETVTLYLGDMREVLPALGQRFDCAIADPPYEETALDWDVWPKGWLEAVAAVTNSLWCWLPFRQFASPPYRGIEFAAAGWKLSHDAEAEWDHWVWEKNTGSGPVADRLRRVHEPAAHWYRGRWADIYRNLPRLPHDGPRKGTVHQIVDRAAHHTGGSLAARDWVDDGMRAARSVLRANNLRGKAIHPTEKPAEILGVMIRYACPPGGIVVDPCAGSGSTGEAARLIGRRAVLIESDEPYCEAIANRLRQDVLPLTGATS
jgi:site-specific DNA-methyltransferase (adenine-specific)